MRAAALIILLAASAAHADESVKTDPLTRLDACHAQIADMNAAIYLHRSCKPLAQVVEELARQGAMDFDMFEDECHGVCGV